MNEDPKKRLEADRDHLQKSWLETLLFDWLTNIPTFCHSALCYVLHTHISIK